MMVSVTVVLIFSVFFSTGTVLNAAKTSYFKEPEAKTEPRSCKLSVCDLKISLTKHQSEVKKEISDLKETVDKLKKEIKMFSKVGTITNPGKSCKEIFQKDRTSVNGLYYLETDTPQRDSVAYCHMENIPGCGSGGWTLVMKTDGTKRTFHYNSNYWANKISYNQDGARSGFSKEETKLPTYWSTSFTKLCLGMEVSGNLRWVTLPYAGSSLYDVIADGSYKSSNIGRAAWKSLIRGSSMQPNCNREGFNINTSMKVRIGLVGNNEKDCRTNDSRIGFGAGGGPGCNTADDSNTCGNNAGCGTDNGNKNTKAFGYILVQ